MDGYKKIFRSRKIRQFILNLLRFVPDKTMIKLQYRIKTGRKLNLKNPHTFSEKIQLYKLKYRDPLMHRCVDKYEVRKYVEEKGLKDILVPLYGRYDNVKQIDLDNLPEQFVLKTTNGGGGFNIFICNDKSTVSKKVVAKKLKCKTVKSRTGGREWAYYGLKPGIVAEKLLVNSENPYAGINDYKFFCYNGKPQYVLVDSDRYIRHKMNFYDLDWNTLNVSCGYPSNEKTIPKPVNFDKMVEIAKTLSSDFPFVRVDLYNIEGQIYFGELTFYPCSGYVQFEPDYFNELFGEKIDLERIMQGK